MKNVKLKQLWTDNKRYLVNAIQECKEITQSFMEVIVKARDVKVGR